MLLKVIQRYGAIRDDRLSHRTLKIGCAVDRSMICSAWNSSAPTEANRLPQGDQVRPAMPTVWKPETVFLTCFVVAFHTTIWNRFIVRVFPNESRYELQTVKPRLLSFVRAPAKPCPVCISLLCLVLETYSSAVG